MIPILDYMVIDYGTVSVAELAGLFLDGWETPKGAHESLSDHDDLSYVVLVKEIG